MKEIEGMSENLFDPVKFGNAFRNAIANDDIGVREAGRQIGCSHATISRICRGFPPDVENYLRISKWLSERSPTPSPGGGRG